MILNRNKLYVILFIACLAGYIWIYFNLSKSLTEKKSVEVCLIKQISNIPCPSCGATRSIISLIKGDFIKAIRINPMGLIIAIIMLLAPIWMTIDIIIKRNSLFLLYQKIEVYLKKPKYAMPLILLVVINWIWNITKGL